MAVTQIRGDKQIKAGTITNAEISGSAAIALSKLAEAVIRADGGQVFTADQSLGGFKLTNVGAPTANNDAANKSYVDSVAQGLDIKDSVRAATTSSIADLSNASVIVDGATLVQGDRVLVKDGASADGIEAVSAKRNGIYVVGTVTTGTAPFTRATDANTSTKVSSGMFMFVTEGTANSDKGFVLITNDPITLNTTLLSFTQFTGTGQITAGDGLTKTGDTLDVTGDVVREADFVTRETPAGAVDGVNTAFTLANTPIAGTEHVYLNGILQEPGATEDYTVSGVTITFNDAPKGAPGNPDIIRVSYLK